MFSLTNLNFVNQIKNLKVDKIVPLSMGQDDLDLIAFQLYGNSFYWSYLAYYNDILNPFDLLTQGFTSIRVFNRIEFDNLIGI